MITEYLALLVLVKGEWCPGAELNSRHADFQSAALPTELSRHLQKRTEWYQIACTNVKTFSLKFFAEILVL